MFGLKIRRRGAPENGWEANLALVVPIARTYSNDQVLTEDLIVPGNHGLLQALKTFRASDEENFLAHAAAHIERAIAEAVTLTRRDNEDTVHTIVNDT